MVLALQCGRLIDNITLQCLDYADFAFISAQCKAILCIIWANVGDEACSSISCNVV